LIIYHNRFATTYGTIHQSASYADKGAGQLRNQSLGGAFGWPNDGNVFLGFRDITTGLEHLERSSKLVSNGYSVELHAYNCHVFLNWRELRPDGEHRWDLLCDHLNSRGVRSLDEALLELEVAPLHHSLLALLQPEVLEGLAGREEGASSTAAALLLKKIETLSTQFARESLAIYARKTGTHVPAKDPWVAIGRQVQAATGLPALEAEFAEAWSREAKMVLPSSDPELHPGAVWGPVLATCVLQGMAETVGGKDAASTVLALFERLRLREPLARAFSFGEINDDGWRAAARVRLVFLNQTLSPKEPFAGLPLALWEEGDARWLLKVHEAAGEWYFNKELHQQILWWIQLPELLELAAPAAVVAEKLAARSLRSVEEIEQRVDEAVEQAEEAGYRLGKKKAVKTSKREKGALAK
jgi:hypothetical protein